VVDVVDMMGCGDGSNYYLYAAGSVYEVYRCRGPGAWNFLFCANLQRKCLPELPGATMPGWVH
jgi:hypothetical protein